jgi:asparagine synthase (glutamine-hydrolysing)
VSGVVGVFDATDADGTAGDAGARRVLDAMDPRADGPSDVRSGITATLGVRRRTWETEPDFAGAAGAVQQDGITVVADATLYYRDDLRRALASAGVRGTGPTASHLILDAYRAWGSACVERLEGDFAFVLWDGRRAVALAARDRTGLRPLYYAVFGHALVVASTVGAVLAHPRAVHDLNLRAIGAVAAGQLYAVGAETTYRAIRAVPAGTALHWRPGAPERLASLVAIPADREAGRLRFDDAAVRLRELLAAAVAERLPEQGSAAVWMSGGWDSTAVYASGKDALARAPDGRDLAPVCISYPEGDPGREDDLIRTVLARWDARASWLDSRDIPLLEDLPAAAAARDQAPALLYGPWNAALAARSRAVGARVALDGNGGDQLFGSSDTYLAGLLATFRWVALGRELRAKRARGWRHLARAAALPLVPPWLLPATALRRGRAAIGHYLERPVPPWVRRAFLIREGVLEHERAHLPRPGGGVVSRESRWMLTAPFVGWAMSRIAELALGQGVELRSPLLDPRMAGFALARPWHDRSFRGEPKRLLRAAMRDLLPAAFLAPRATRTGITVGYSRSWMRRYYPSLFAELFRAPLRLAELGVVDPFELERAAAAWVGGRADEYTRVHLYHTLETELWLRAHSPPMGATTTRVAAAYRDRYEARAPQRSSALHSSP